MSDNPLVLAPAAGANALLSPRLQLFGAIPSLRPPPAPGEEDRVSTRIPTAVKQTIQPHRTADLQVDTASARQAPDAYAINAQLLRDFPDLPVRGMRNPDNIVQASIGHMAENLKFLHRQMVEKFGQEMVDRASRWYDGANVIAHRWAGEFGYHPRQVAAAMANLSPQKDWFQNVSLAHRMMTVLRDKQAARMTPEMAKWAQDYIDAAHAKADTPSKAAAVDALRMSLAGARNRAFNQINDPETRAFWLRAYDEAHHSRDYPLVSPEGEMGETVLTDKGVPRKVAWGSFTEIGKALAALEGSGDLEAISRGLGGNHKVRSFYNNIISPNARHGDVTIDTHAIAAAHLRPLSGTDYPVELGLGLTGSSDAATGNKGTYHVYAEAYRRAAAELGLLPRQLQSITWEGIRGLFSPEQKRNIPFWNQNFDLWHAHKRGIVGADDTRQIVLHHGGGIDPPQWWRPNIPPEVPSQ